MEQQEREEVVVEGVVHHWPSDPEEAMKALEAEMVLLASNANAEREVGLVVEARVRALLRVVEVSESRVALALLEDGAGSSDTLYIDMRRHAHRSCVNGPLSNR